MGWRHPPLRETPAQLHMVRRGRDDWRRPAWREGKHGREEDGRATCLQPPPLSASLHDPHYLVCSSIFVRQTRLRCIVFVQSVLSAVELISARRCLKSQSLLTMRWCLFLSDKCTVGFWKTLCDYSAICFHFMAAAWAKRKAPVANPPNMQLS